MVATLVQHAETFKQNPDAKESSTEQKEYQEQSTPNVL
jgi:hypothetical protein